MDLPCDATKLSGSRPMNAGEGRESYGQNSTYQRQVINLAKGVISQAILENIDVNKSEFDPSNPFRIADLGCSTGQNTIIAMQNIVEAVELKYKAANLGNSSFVPEFHVFFNDQIDNDFNTLFRNLATSARKYFISGVPGSFYQRLFPEKSLQIVHSSYALHWLSKVPDGVQDKSSLAYNKDNIHCSGDNEMVTRAYVAQFERDMMSFLEARANELVVVGILIIQIPSQKGVSPQKMHELLGQNLFDLEKMGFTTEEKVCSFSLPLFFPPIDLVEAVIHKNNCFTIESIQTLPDHIPLKTGKMTSSALRSVFEGIMKEHFGSEHMNQLFDIFTQKVEDYYMEAYNEEKDAYDVDFKPTPPASLLAIIKRKAF